MRDVITLGDAMTRSFVGVTESDTVAETAALLAEEGNEGALVVRGGEAVGRVRASDLLGALPENGDEPVRTVMVDPPPSFDPGTPVEEAALALSREHDWRATVADGEDVLGVVGAREVLAAGVGRSESGPGVSAPDPTTEYGEQGVCESCGTLAGSLARSEGKLLCAACREV